MSDESDRYPVHAKLKVHKDEALLIGNFIDFLEDHGIALCEFVEGDFRQEYVRTNRTPEQIIGLFLDIDPAALEAEKVALLEEQRRLNMKRA